MMKTYYETSKGLKFVEEDKFKEGGLPDTAQSWEVDITFQADTVKELMIKIMEYFDVPKEYLELNSCEENGRIDIALLEDRESYKATEDQRRLWKSGRLKLYYAVYSFQVSKTTKEEVIL